MEFQLTCRKSKKMMLWKCYTEYPRKFGNLSSDHKTGQDQLHSNPKMETVKECSNSHTTVLISHACKVMLKILQVTFQQYLDWELLDVQYGFRKGRGTRDQISNIHWLIEKARELHKNIHFCFIDYNKALNCVDHNKSWEIFKEMRIPDHFTYLLRNLCAG